VARGLAPWLVLGAATAACSLALGAAGLESPVLFAALMVGLVTSLVRPGRLALPDAAFTAAQAIVGVTLGAYLQSSSLSAVAGEWVPVALVGAATLAISLAAGVVLARLTELDGPTAALGMVAGGASGIVGISDELGGDDRLVAFMQYLRVLIVVVLTPLLVALAFPGHHAGSAPHGQAPPFGDANGWLLTLGCAVVGALAARAFKMTAGMLLGPMLLAGGLTLAGVRFAVPAAVQQVAFATIGLQVGLKFTVATIKQVGRLVGPVLLGLLGVIVACAGLAAVLALTTKVSLLDAYLATTPGGLYAVLAIAFGANANTTFILATQGLRLVVMVVLAPLAVRRMFGRRQAMAGAPSGSRSSADCRSSSENSGSSSRPAR
jgi:membrane AbrB-like protein